MTKTAGHPVLTAARPVSGTGSACGTSGELVQGVIPEGDFMVTFPIDLEVHAEARTSPAPGLEVWPQHKVKARSAVLSLLRMLGKRPGPGEGVRVQISSPIPDGKGMASSSADIVAACRAVADLHGVELTDEVLAALACGVEPSDAVMIEHPVVFDFLRGRVLRDPGRPLPVLAVVVDPGGSVDTVNFRRLPYDAEERELIGRAHDMAVGGLLTQDLSAVGAAATISARVNQRRHPKKALEQLLPVALGHGGHGVSVAHSGTTLAMLFDPHDTRRAHEAAREAAALAPTAQISFLRGRTPVTPS
ncbi:kinase [Streptomyces sp. NPDC001852]|uniref:GHMP family kinase ATP-binding protein n=1 Tax=Streptomyces sp. NPDC001852 TaxID=3364619 RepID=UPI0036C3A95C